MKDRTKNTPQVLLRRALLVLLDAAIVAFSFYFALLLRADGAVEAGWWPHNRALLYENLPWIVAVYIVCFLAGGLYSVLWKYAGERDLIRLAGMIAVPTAVVYVVNRRFIHGVLFNSANCMASVLIFLFIGGSRLAWRLFLNHPLGERMRKVPAKDPNRPVLIVGAGEAGAWAINVCKSNKEYGHAVVAVDDDPAKLNQTIHGVPVKGTLEDIPELCNRYGIHSIIIAIPTLKGSKLSHVIDLCVSTHCAVQLLSDPQLVGSGAPQQEVFRELNPADFLSREEVTLDTDKISGYLTGKTVLVTGGGGSIGSELCRQVMRFKPGKLLIFDIYENCAYELQMELQQKYGRDIPVTVLIGSIRDKKRLDEVFDTYHPTVVFHAAAHKHVPLMEVSPAEAVKNNVLGTKNLLVSASEHGVERFVQSNCSALKFADVKNQTIFNNFVYGSVYGIHFLKDEITGKYPGKMTMIGHGSDGCTYSLFVEDADKDTKIIAVNSELVNTKIPNEPVRSYVLMGKEMNTSKVHPDAKLILYNSAFWGSPVFGAIINSGIVSFQQANFSRSGTYGVDVRGGRAHVYTSYFAQEIPDTVTLNGYARLGMYGNLIELTNNYYISGFRFDKEGKGILCGSDKR